MCLSVHLDLANRWTVIVLFYHVTFYRPWKGLGKCTTTIQWAIAPRKNGIKMPLYDLLDFPSNKCAKKNLFLKLQFKIGGSTSPFPPRTLRALMVLGFSHHIFPFEYKRLNSKTKWNVTFISILLFQIELVFFIIERLFAILPTAYFSGRGVQGQLGLCPHSTNMMAKLS